MWKKYPENKPKYPDSYYSVLIKNDEKIERHGVLSNPNCELISWTKREIIAFYDDDPSEEFLESLEGVPEKRWHCVCGHSLNLKQLLKDGSLYVPLYCGGFYAYCDKCRAQSSTFKTPEQAYK